MGINFVLYKKRFSMALYYLDFKNNAQKRCVQHLKLLFVDRKMRLYKFYIQRDITTASFFNSTYISYNFTL